MLEPDRCCSAGIGARWKQHVGVLERRCGDVGRHPAINGNVITPRTEATFKQ